MDLSFLFKGLILGFSIAAPVGPIGVLCIRRTLAEGRLSGFFSGLGAATADAFYGSLAAFGLTLVTDFLVGQQSWFRLFGGLFLCYLGLRTFLSRPATEAASANAGNLFQNYASTLVLTISNPMTILSFVAVFAGLGLASGNNQPSSAASLVLGVFIGSAMWWFFLSAGVGIFRSYFQNNILQWVNRISGFIILAFGILALASLIPLFH